MCLTSSQSSLPGSSHLTRFIEVSVEVGGWAGVKVRCQHVICGSLMLQLVEKKGSLKHHFCAHFCACSSCAQEKTKSPSSLLYPMVFFPIGPCCLGQLCQAPTHQLRKHCPGCQGLYTLFAVEFCLMTKGSTRLM